MTYNQLHTYQHELTKVLNNQFKKQLLSIHPKAHLCYHGHIQVFTVSLFELNRELESKLNSPVTASVETEHLCLISEYKISPEVEQLVQDLTKFIMNEVPQQNLKEQI